MTCAEEHAPGLPRGAEPVVHKPYARIIKRGGQMERPDGQRVWKQEAAFTAEDYAAIIAYHVEQVRHAQYMVQATTAAYRHDN